MQRSALLHRLEIVDELATGGALYQFSDGSSDEEVTNHTNGNQTHHAQDGSKDGRAVILLVHRARVPCVCTGVEIRNRPSAHILLEVGGQRRLLGRRRRHRGRSVLRPGVLAARGAGAER